jgi:glutaconyl-CoA/methylmalonyl-CoA decarboxylase subunit gamma
MNVVVKVGDRVFEVTIENTSARPIIAMVEGERFEVWPENPNPLPAGSESSTQPGAAARRVPSTVEKGQTSAAIGTLSGKTMTSPLPGTVTEVFVKEGELVEAGHVALVIEAMKMKNSIRTTRAGKISAVLVNTGETVTHKQPLIEFSE